MEVLILNDFCSINGGAAFVAIASARQLAERGTKVTFFGVVGPIAEELHHPNITCICLEQKDILRDNRARAFINGIYNSTVDRALNELLDQKDSSRTVIHIHGCIKALSPNVMRVALRRGFATVVTLHDYAIACPNGAFLIFPTTTICHLEPLSFACISCQCDSRNYGHKLWRVARLEVQNNAWKITRRLQYGIFPSHFTQRILAPYLPNLKESRVIRYPVHAPANPPADPRAGDAFIFIGRFSREKGVLLLAEAAKRAQIRVVFIGSGDDELQAAVRTINPDAEMTGWLSQAEITERLRHCRALVMPSLWYETTGLVALEAMAQGVPVIVPDNCAITDFVQDGVTGLFFAQANADSLTAQIERMKDPQLAATLGRAAYDWYWNDPWTIEKHTDGLQQLYDEMLATVPAGA